jgi:ABC-type hemin transport system ATPase subunit
MVIQSARSVVVLPSLHGADTAPMLTPLLALWLAREGHAVLAILHDLNLTAQYADEVFVIAGGKVCASGPAVEIVKATILSDAYGCRVIEVREGGQRALVSLPPGNDNLSP